MPYEHLSQFLDTLSANGHLARVADTVDPVSELPALIRRACGERDGGPAVFCQRVGEAKFPLVANLFGGTRLLASLDADSPETVIRRLTDWRASLNMGVAAEPSKTSNPLLRLSRLLPRFQKTAFVQQVIRMGKDVDLAEFPFPRWSVESAPSITNAVVFFPGTSPGQPQVEQPALQAADATALTVHWTAHHAGPAAYEEARRQGKPIPVAVVLGADPALIWAAGAPCPAGLSPLQLASIVRGSGLNLVRGRTVELDLPADAEIVIEGYVDPLEAPSGRGGVATGLGTVTGRTDLPLLRITAITHRANPVLPVTVRHPSPGEADSFLRLSAALLESELRLLYPAVERLAIVPTGELPRVLFVSLRKDYPGLARQVMHALWGQRWLTGLKCIVAVDAGHPLDPAAVWQTVALCVDPERDVMVMKGPADFDDHALWPGFGSRMGIDATRKRPDEGGIEWPESLESAVPLRSRLDYLWSKAGWNRP